MIDRLSRCRITIASCIAMALCVAIGGCDKTPDAPAPSPAPSALPAPPENLFVNGDFENGAQPWFSLESDIWGPTFTVSADHAFAGKHSARLIASTRDYPDKAAHICGVIQEIRPDRFPQTLRGRYRVNAWEKHNADLYVQFVVIVFGADNPPPGLERATNFQIRYPLAGIAAPPFGIGNAQWVFVNTAEPVVGQWVEFERDIRLDFLQQWGRVPRGFSKIRVLFEARWDNHKPTDPPSTAEVFFDDLYIGD